jgi:glutamate synthase (NADPH/NADH) small chain
MLGETCFVVGLGNVAIDIARTLIRLGKKVHIAYRRTISKAPAGPSEIEAALHEGVIIHELVAPVHLIKEGVHHRLTCHNTCLVKKDNESRETVEIIPDSEIQFEIDDLIFATGQRTSELLFKGTSIIPNPTQSPYATNDPYVFIGGDRVTKQKRIVDAMVTGQEVADHIMKGFYEILS